MKKYYVSILFLFSFIAISYSQKKLQGILIEGTDLYIFAKAEKLSKVEFTITKGGETNEEQLAVFTTSPFNTYTFKVGFMNVLHEIYKNKNDQKLKDSLINTEFNSTLNEYFSHTKDPRKYFEATNKLNEKTRYVFNYFDTQLELLFKYDDEPVAGRLFYNTNVRQVQYFPNRSYETYFNNRTRNYHKLIKKLYLISRDTNNCVDEKNENDTIDNCFEKKYQEKIRDYFSKKAKEYKDKYVEQPKIFMDNFGDIVNNFRNYNRKKRMQLVFNELLKLKNKEVYETLFYEMSEYKKSRDSLNKYTLIQDNFQKLKKLSEEVSKYKKELKDVENNKDNNIKELEKEYKTKTELFKNKITASKKEITSIRDEYSLNEPDVESLNNLKAFLKEEIAYFPKLKKPITEHIDLVESKKKLEQQNNKSKSREIGSSKEKKEGLHQEIKNIMGQVDEVLKKGDFFDLKLSVGNNLYIEDFLGKISNSNNTIYKNKFTIKHIDSIIVETEKSIKENSKIILRKLKKAPLWQFKAEDIQLDINDGFVEHIVVLGRTVIPTSYDEQLKDFNDILNKIRKDNPGLGFNINKKLKFVNQFPYGFSSSKDYDDFKEYKLYVYNGKHRQFEMRLQEIFPNYVQTLQNDRLDFSPKDQVVNLPINLDAEGSVELKKDKSSKLFNLSAYSDFNGLKESDPNGVIQFEVNKIIPLYTKRKTWLFGERYLNRGFNYGYANYINPQLRWSRLDASNDDKNLRLTYLPISNGGTQETIVYVTQLDLLRYENISVGADINMLSLDFPTSKLRLEINASGRYGRTKVLDTEGRSVTSDNNGNETSNIKRTFNINTWRFYPEFILRLRPEERYGASISFKPIKFNTVTNDFLNISSEEFFIENLTDEEQWLHQTEINAHFSPSVRKNDKFFFRYRYTNNIKNESNGYSEIQLGYSMSLKF